jgi:hypothetical protein
MGKVSRDHALEAGAKIQTNIDWDQIDSKLLDEILKDPIALGREATLFLANRARMQVSITTDGIVIPQGGRIHIVPVAVNESRDWNEAVAAAGRNTDKGSDIWKMGDQYPPSEVGSGLSKIILVNFGSGKNTLSQDNLAWAKSQHLVSASPRKVFAVGEHCPTLNRVLGMDSMAVVSLKECSFVGRQLVTCVWFYGSKRKAHLSWFGNEWGDGCWFAFVRESEASLLAG